MRQKRSSQSENQVVFNFEKQEPLQKRALYYGEAEILPNVLCECYVLEDNQSTMSERGFSSLLGIDHTTLMSMVGNWPPKTLESFCDKEWSMSVTFALVEAEKSPYKNQRIVVYNTQGSCK